ncbi:hypothetical protein [Streptomyces soliscabiei]|uniref:hypothetical protein n=1 Tax=Streptomyces soliscabiei TaxID=588897 RepID=UPI0029B92074|nr:hypothetical protein [Streptomyces sp. NY05-11A]MDX2677444.1 hypothetical protein [Streptomyces sp. NY05-11A]
MRAQAMLGAEGPRLPQKLHDGLLRGIGRHYKDDKVDWFFAHMDQVANAHVAGLLFGAGWTEQTTVESDGGNLIRKTIAYHNSGGTRLK